MKYFFLFFKYHQDAHQFIYIKEARILPQEIIQNQKIVLLILLIHLIFFLYVI
ncbi:unnamed protein product [Nezara viridula]|uniref:Uncharacterized protein n=1 Tax=Nezara viridula TaxID=85310 RepID=A0A9P0H0U9_NEZVI|nr:unnamed protein product [Nezara viridula]